MNTILGINTASRNIEVCLTKEQKIVFEESFEAKQNEASKLQPMIQAALEQNNLTPQDLDSILVCEGPGRFTGLRIGILAGNAFGYSLQIPLIPFSVFDMWQGRLENKESLVILQGGRSSYFVKDADKEVEILDKGELDQFKDHENTYVEISENVDIKFKTYDQLISFGEWILTLDLEKMPKTDIVEPVYLRGANITKPTKQCSL